MGIESRGFEVAPWLAAVEDANWDMVGEMITRTPEDRTMLGWAAANILSKNLNFRTAAAMVYEKSPVDLTQEVIGKLATAMEMEDSNEETVEARYYAAKALLEHDEMSGGVEVVIKKTANCDDPELSGLALECLDVIEKKKQEKKMKNSETGNSK